MSEGNWVPKTWKEAIPYIVWGIIVLGFGLELCAALVRLEWRQAAISFVGMVIVAASGIHWARIRALSSNLDGRWLAAALFVWITALAISPFVEQRKWPFELWRSLASQETPSAEIIAAAVVKDLGPKLSPTTIAISPPLSSSNIVDQLQNRIEALTRICRCREPVRFTPSIGQMPILARSPKEKDEILDIISNSEKQIDDFINTLGPRIEWFQGSLGISNVAVNFGDKAIIYNNRVSDLKNKLDKLLEENDRSSRYKDEIDYVFLENDFQQFTQFIQSQSSAISSKYSSIQNIRQKMPDDHALMGDEQSSLDTNLDLFSSAQLAISDWAREVKKRLFDWRKALGRQ